LSDLKDGLAAIGGGVTACGGKWYFCDPTHGTEGGDGETPQTANSNLKTLYDRCRDGYNDGVFFIPGATAYSPAAAFVWSKSYTHLVGLTNGLRGMGTRARIVNTAALDLATLFTMSGDGNLLSGIQFFDGKDKTEDGANVLISGSRNRVVNCFAAGMGSAVASGPFSRAGSYSMKVSGDENAVEDSTVGVDTVARTAANHELIVSGVRNRFDGCDIRSNSVTPGKFLVQIDNSVQDMRDVQFNDCKFFNYSSNWATGVTDAFNIPAAGNTVYLLLDEKCRFYGVGMGVGNNVTHIYATGAAPAAGFGLMTNPTT
jgi:hypothetical protein